MTLFRPMHTFSYIFPLIWIPTLITGGYVANQNNAAAGGYSYSADVGGYPYPQINNNNNHNNNHNHGGYESSASITGGYPASNGGGYPDNSGYPANNAGGYPESSGGYPSGGYGAPCCPNKYPFLPAPPGQTPPCSKHGSTFCEKLDNYPTETIRYLLYKYGSTYLQFIKTEINQDFVMMTQNYSYFYPKPEYGANLYGSYGAPSNQYNYNTNLINNTYQQQQQQQFYNPNLNYNNNHQSVSPSSSYPLLSHEQAAAFIIPPLLHSIWWNHVDKNTKLPAFPYMAQHRFHHQQQNHQQRVKRQATGDNQLCRLSSRFITPRAAMNNQGNWMYLVNMDDTRFMQQVRTEECADGDGSACDGLCSIPPGYRSSCRQKYVQKRLVALDGSGASLRGEVFWFPHCCVCEVTRG